ncbi:methylated-DNA-[protein]-cysteine S-methyltransferase [Jannaschia faecimaris]|uniref:Methylated-DNA--protein-cysteine methyltransferase n=1 Tax=Jannaschia faecimaris TaxID=1244108 RepID=A0A1H3MHA2_9RHOB|nr:methylated-DNA--[protein]-cysteine S-methyltransferase [Jannaschia faecimaris]SDY75923.1 methylated-DNA-[protein]-cysteine S-methyltransferase [Jannaschia faecimaris]
MIFVRHETAAGPLCLAGQGEVLTDARLNAPPDAEWQECPDAFAQARRQLDAYFDRKCVDFDLPLAPRGTPFQRRVWHALQAIPPGETCSYADLAQAVRRPGGTQAVGQANGKNPIAILIPCHRVIAADGGPGGYAHGPAIKRHLLELEGALPVQSRLI